MGYWDTYGQAYDRAYNSGNALGDMLKQSQARQQNQRVAQALQAGDYGAAAAEFAKAGDIQNFQRVQQEQRTVAADAQTKAKEYLLNASSALLKVPAEQRQQTYAAQIRPALQQFGAPEELLTQIDGADKSDQSLSAFVAALGGAAPERQKLEFRQAGESVFGLDPYTGQQVVRYEGNKRVIVPEGATLFEVGAGGQQAAPDAPAPGGDWLQRVAEAAPDATVSSGYRTPEHNEEVGGRPNSRHLRGEAVDLVPRPGETMAQLFQRVSNIPGTRAINEGDHVHVQTTGEQAAAPTSARVVAQGAAKPAWQTLSPQEAQQLGLDPSMRYQRGPQGQINPIGGQTKRDEKFTDGQRTAASLAYAAFAGNTRLNDLAEQGIYKPQTATESLFKTDKNGFLRLTARTEQDRRFIQAAKEFLAPVLRKDSGAAVTDEELSFYMDTYIPRYEDSPAVLWQKAQARDTALRRVYGSSSGAYDAEYGKPEKWRVLTDSRGRPKGKDQAGGKFEVLGVVED